MTRPLAISIRKASRLSGLRPRTLVAELEAGRLSGRRVGEGEDAEWVVYLDSLESLLRGDRPSAPVRVTDPRVRAALKKTGVI